MDQQSVTKVLPLGELEKRAIGSVFLFVNYHSFLFTILNKSFSYNAPYCFVEDAGSIGSRALLMLCWGLSSGIKWSTGYSGFLVDIWFVTHYSQQIFSLNLK